MNEPELVGHDMQINALVTTGHGINCEAETRNALELAGFDRVDLLHLNFLASNKIDLSIYGIIVFPGGFLDGDDLGAAQACANRIRHSKVEERTLIDRILEFVHSGGLILGICNGFQLLVKLGMLPGLGGNYSKRDLSLTANNSGRFEDRWVNLTVDRYSPCVFTSGLDNIYLPIRHGEGKLVAKSPELISAVLGNHQVALRYAHPDNLDPTMTYPYNPNGSEYAIAGVCDPTGRVFGMMPHPECFVHRTNHPRWTREFLPDEGAGLGIFRNAVKHVRGS